MITEILKISEIQRIQETREINMIEKTKVMISMNVNQRGRQRVYMTDLTNKWMIK